jgi:hypothetical protein
MDTPIVFRSAPTITPPGEKAPPPDINEQQVQSGEDDKEPIELRETHGVSVVLDALGIDDVLSNLPIEDKSNVGEVREYVLDIIKSKGLPQTVASFKKTIDMLKDDMGLDKEAEPSIVLDRIAGVVKAWKNLSFIKDPDEKRRIFYKLATMNSSEDMNREVYKLMSDYKIWR